MGLRKNYIVLMADTQLISYEKLPEYTSWKDYHKLKNKYKVQKGLRKKYSNAIDFGHALHPSYRYQLLLVWIPLGLWRFLTALLWLNDVCLLQTNPINNAADLTLKTSFQ